MAESQSIQTAASAPIFGPDGEVHLIPNQQVPEALANRGELAVPMRNPQTNELHYVRKSEVPAAMQAGGKVDFNGVPQAHKDGFLGALGSDLGGMAKGLVTSLPPVAAVQAIRQGIDNVKSLRDTGKTVQQQEYDQRRAEGYNPAYSALAPAAQAAGLNVPGMEQAAREGDTGAVVGHAAAPVVAAAATAGAMKYGPRAASTALDAVKTSAPVEALSEVRQALTAPQNLEAGEAAVKAVRPRNSIVDAKAKIETALPDARRAADTLGIDTSKMTLEDAESAVSQAKKDVWGEFESRFLGPNRRIGLDTSPVADRINSVAENMSDIQKRRLGTDKITDAASDYDGKIHSLDQVETRIQELNNSLRSQQAQFKVNEMALRRDPAYAHQFAELDGLRQIEAEAFDQLSGEGAPELKQRYGALKVLEDTLQRRANVADRAAPTSLPQAMGRMRGLGKVAKGMATFSPGDVIEGLVNLKAGENARLYNDPDFLIQQAFSKTQPSPAPLAPNPRPIAGLLPRGPVPMGPGETSAPGPPSFHEGTNIGTRAERLGLLLPERTSIPLPSRFEGIEPPSPAPPYSPTTRAERLGLEVDGKKVEVAPSAIKGAVEFPPVSARPIDFKPTANMGMGRPITVQDALDGVVGTDGALNNWLGSSGGGVGGNAVRHAAGEILAGKAESPLAKSLLQRMNARGEGEITLYRGGAGPVDVASSWTSDPKKAAEFGPVTQAKMPRKWIAATPEELKSKESEYLVIARGGGAAH